MHRCSWVDKTDNIYIDYHDNEWGIPIHEDRLLFEALVLEYFQSGLSWQCILHKREFFRKAFDNFNIKKVSKYKTDKINELLNNKNIIRNKLKILATINNAQIFLEIQKQFESFNKYIWNWTNNKVIQSNPNETESDLSNNIYKDLKQRGMKFIGSATIYSYLSAIGIINAHESICYKTKL